VSRRYPPPLSRRERQIMDVIYRLERATAAEVLAELPDAPTYTTVRGLLRVLEAKGHLRHEQEDRRYVYIASLPRATAGASFLSHVVRTFFDGSPTDAMAALLGSQSERISDDELARLATLVAKARRGKRGSDR
jgi:predicted transcriptional regulator